MKLNLKSRKIALPAMPKRESHPEVASLPYNTPSPDKPRERDLTHLIKDSAVKLESVCKRVKQTYEGLEETPPEPLEARDRRVIVPYEFKRKSFVLSNEKNDLNIWIGEMHFKVVSVSFNFLVSHQLTYEQVKVFCCQNLLLNIILFLEAVQKPREDDEEHSTLSLLQIAQLMKHINDTLQENLKYLLIKYPQAKEEKPNKQLRAMIAQINNLDNDENDMIMKSGVEFKLKKQDNYIPEIMRFLNFLISKQGDNSKVQHSQTHRDLSYFEYFYDLMEQIFTSVYYPETYLKKMESSDKDRQNLSPQHKIEPDQAMGELPMQALVKEISKMGDFKGQAESVREKELKEYKERVSKYTSYKISQKVSTNTELYSEHDFKTEIFEVKSGAILRILTKWTEELENKLKNAEENLLRRPFRFKKNKPKQFAKLNANQKNELYQQGSRKVKEMQSFFEQLKENYNQIEAMLSNNIKQPSRLLNLPRFEYSVGYFCSKVQSAASSAQIAYLNKIIHILLSIPADLKRNHAQDESYQQQMDINLITFKIGDLFRCKCKSKEAEIIRIFAEIKKIGVKGTPFKIVRIKDRLETGTRDILININFMGIYLAEIQLAVEETVDTKQQSFDNFNHFLYQLKRSQLGTIMESACIWAQFDQRSKMYRSIQGAHEQQLCKYVSHPCGKDSMAINKYSFVCSLCEQFYACPEGIVPHRKCKKCKLYYECASCLFCKMAENDISDLLGLSEKLGHFMSEFKMWKCDDRSNFQYPRYGLIVSRKMKTISMRFFQTLIFKLDAFLVRVDDNANIQIIEVIRGNSFKNWRRLPDNYIIYEWTETRFCNQTLKPDKIQKEKEEEQKLREMLAKEKKEEREKRKKQLEQKRKQEEEGDKKGRRHKDFEDLKDNDKAARPKTGTKKNTDEDEQGGFDEPISNLGPLPVFPQMKPKAIRYNESIAPRNTNFEFRVINKEFGDYDDYLVLNCFLKQSQIRNQLKQLNNKDLLRRILSKKIEVLFVEDEYIHDQLNKIDDVIEEEIGTLQEGLSKINQVYFDNNFIEDLQLFRETPNLRVAHLSNNKLSDCSNFSTLQQLSELILENNNFSTMDFSSNEMIELNLNRNNLTTLNGLENVPNLQIFLACDNDIADMNHLQALTRLVRLDLSYNAIEAIVLYTTLNNLVELDLSFNVIQQLTGIQSYVSLKKLNLSRNRIKALTSSISELKSLVQLQIASNQIVKIENLSLLKELRLLNLSNNRITSMEGLDDLENLRTLDLSDNLIEQVSNYLDLTSLEKLDLSNNAIQHLNVQGIVKDLPNLTQLMLHMNQIHETQENIRIIQSLVDKFANLTCLLPEQMRKVPAVSA